MFSHLESHSKISNFKISSYFNHILDILFIQEVLGKHTSLFLDTDQLKKDFTGLKNFQNFQGVKEQCFNVSRNIGYSVFYHLLVAKNMMLSLL